MNYAFKMMAVVLALGVVVLQGCQNSNKQYNNNYVRDLLNQIANESQISNEIASSQAFGNNVTKWNDSLSAFMFNGYIRQWKNMD